MPLRFYRHFVYRHFASGGRDWTEALRRKARSSRGAHIPGLREDAPVPATHLAFIALREVSRFQFDHYYHGTWP